ncbi:MAG: NUDIX domain-containing protein [Dysgonamonadaceae bacterium]|nr:NUDIX domain-containing protein [Dysgonamonadaceae bacterium]
MRKVINIIAIKDKKILLVRKRETWILPGGKPNLGESDAECLLRELSEELPKLSVIGDFKLYKSFTGQTPHQGDIVEAVAYFSKIQGEIKPDREISEALWTNNFDNIKLSEITTKIINPLYKDGYL